MFTKFDKAGAGAIAAAVTGLLAHFTTMDAELITAIGTVLTAVLVYAVPNKE